MTESPTARTARLLQEEGARNVLKSLQFELQMLHDAPTQKETYRPGLRMAERAVIRHLRDLGVEVE